MVEFNGVQYPCPSSWKEVKTRHYQKIIKDWDQDKDISERDYFKLFRILTDTDVEFVDTFENQVYIEAKLAFIVLENFKFDNICPKKFELLGKQIDLPEEIKKLSIGANIKARQVLDKALQLVDKDGKFLNCDCYSFLVAIYLQPQLMPHPKGGFNWSYAQKLEKEIGELPIYIIRPIGFFLRKKVYEYGQKRVSILNRILTSLT